MARKFDDSARQARPDDALDVSGSAASRPAHQPADEPNYATTDIDTTPGSARPVAADRPNYATTDIDLDPDPDPDDSVRHSGPIAPDPADEG